MDDLIKRSDAIEAVRSCKAWHFMDVIPVLSALKDLPSAERPQGYYDKGYCDAVQGIADEMVKQGKYIVQDRPQGWIPCSERLPSEQGQYLVTFPLCNGEPWVYILSFNKGKFYETDDEWGDVEYDDVTAWMPLPKPWKGADNEAD